MSAPVPPEELKEVLFHCHPRVTGQFSTIALTIRKSLLERRGLFNERLRLRQDTHLWRHLTHVGGRLAGIAPKENTNCAALEAWACALHEKYVIKQQVDIS